MANILITGASGLLGSHLAAQLLGQGNHVRLLRRHSSNTKYFEAICKFYGLSIETLAGRLAWFEADVRNRDALDKAMEGIEVVFHSAAMVSFWNRKHAEMYDVNVNGTSNMVNAALDAGITYFGHVSSIAALGRAASGEWISEENQWVESKYNTAYAKTKYLSELEVWRGFAEGLKGTIINPGVILGEGNWNDGSLKIVKSAAKGFPFYPGGKNGYVDVRDCVKALCLLWEQQITGERYILVEGSYALKEILEKLAARFGKKAPYIRIPAGVSVPVAHLIQLWSSLVSGREPFLSPETAANSDAEFLYDNQKIVALNGFQFTPIEHTIQRVSSFFNQAKADN